jgi:hypothetical protein
VPVSKSGTDWAQLAAISNLLRARLSQKKGCLIMKSRLIDGEVENEEEIGDERKSP